MATIALTPLPPRSLTIELPMPPSVNRLTVNLTGGGRAKSAEYKAWLEEARWHVMMAWRNAGKPEWSDGPMTVLLELGLQGRIRDAGNCLKAVEDLLVKNLPVPDDRWNDRIEIIRNENLAGKARVSIAALESG